jgi:ENTH domain
MSSFSSFISSIQSSISKSITTINKTPLEKTLIESLSNENWGVANSTLTSLAESTYSHVDGPVIVEYLLEAINEQPSKWRRILKALNLLEYILKVGSERVGSDLQFRIGGRVRELSGSSFAWIEEGKNRGLAVNEKAKNVEKLWTDKDELAKARNESKDKGKEINNKFGGLGSGGELGIASSNSSGFGGGRVVVSSATTSTGVDRLTQLRNEAKSAPAQQQSRQAPVQKPAPVTDLLDFDFSPKSSAQPAQAKPKKAAETFEAFGFDDGFGDFQAAHHPSKPQSTAASSTSNAAAAKKSTNPFDSLIF